MEHPQETEVIVDRHRAFKSEHDRHLAVPRGAPEIVGLQHQLPVGRLLELGVPVVERLQRELRRLQRADVAERERGKVRRVASHVLAHRLDPARAQERQLTPPGDSLLAAAPPLADAGDEVRVRGEHERLVVQAPCALFFGGREDTHGRLSSSARSATPAGGSPPGTSDPPGSRACRAR